MSKTRLRRWPEAALAVSLVQPTRVRQYVRAASILSKLAFVFAILRASALSTQLIGIHALFWASLAGIVMSTPGGSDTSSLDGLR